MSDTLSQDQKNAIEASGYQIEPLTDMELKQMAISLGYQPYPYIATKDDRTGILVQVLDTTYNNGIYLLINKNNTVLLEVIQPNTKDKGSLILQLATRITSDISKHDTTALTTFDWVEILGIVIQNTILNPLTDSLFDGDSEKSERFKMIYMTRFLSQVAAHYVGLNEDGEQLYEEQVNSQPYAIKQMVDRVTDEAREKEENDEKTHL